MGTKVLSHRGQDIEGQRDRRVGKGARQSTGSQKRYRGYRWGASIEEFDKAQPKRIQY